MKRLRQALLFVLLVAAGSLQMAGDVLGLPWLKALGAATQVAPAMKVFTAHHGYETFANRFHVGWRDADARWHEVRLDPQRYARVQGPYNRRNVYGAAIAYGPLLSDDPRTQAMFASVVRYGLCAPGVLRGELGIPRYAATVRVRVEPMREPAEADLPMSWEILCHD